MVLTLGYLAHQYMYRGSVDNNNDMRHDGRIKHQVGLENVCITHRCAIKIFVFLMARREVNSYLCLKYFLKKYK